MKLYFAYGSNMDIAQMKHRCPENRLIGKALLPRYRWIITRRGYATVVPSQQDEVEGVLFEISKKDEERLDCYEGVQQGSYHKEMLHVLHEGEDIQALIYIDPITEVGVPKREYIQRINKAIRSAGLSKDYVVRYIRPFIPEEDDV